NVYNENDAIYILLFYHGKKEWNLPLTFYSSHGNAASESLTEGTVDVRARVSYIVRDLGRMSKEQLAWRFDGKRYTSTALWYIMRDNEIDTEGLKEIAQLLNGLSSQDFTDLAESVLGYLKDLDPKLYEQFEKINRKLYPEGENSMRTYNITNAFVREGIAKGMEKGILKGMEKGILKGRREGIRETARSMFSKGFSAHDIQDVTGLSDEEIRTVRNGSH
ncbi:MAG: Rpn family recombination-promoting nuclease/putative transposase, partial [Salinispira sp.]